MMSYWGYPNMMGMMGWGFFPGGIIAFLFFILFWIFVALLISALFRGFRYHRDIEGEEEEKDGKNALNILKERYAKGEINKKEYEEMKKTIS